MFRTRGATRMVRMRPWGSFRSVNLPAKEPTGQPVEPTKMTKDRLWDRFSAVENRFGGLLTAVDNRFSGLLKDMYNRDLELRTNFTSLKGGFRLVGWQLTSLTAVILFMGSTIFYFIDKVEKHFPAAVVAVLVEKNYLFLPPPPSIETPASTPPPKTGK